MAWMRFFRPMERTCMAWSRRGMARGRLRPGVTGLFYFAPAGESPLPAAPPPRILVGGRGRQPPARPGRHGPATPSPTGDIMRTLLAPAFLLGPFLPASPARAD